MGTPFMQPSRILLLAGAVTAGAIGLAGLAFAGDSGLKTLRLQLPGGQVAQIAYSGPVAPQVVLIPGVAMPPGVADAIAANPFAPVDPFAQLDRISAMMNQQAAAMMQAMQVMAMPHLPGISPLTPAAFAALPAGSGGSSYSFVSVSNSIGGGCMQSIAITSGGPGQASHVVRQSAGNCGAGNGSMMNSGTPAETTVAPPAHDTAPKLIRVRDVRPIAVPQPSQT